MCWLSSPANSDEFLMASPGKTVFSETFTEGAISERWGIKQFFIIEDGVLKRSAHKPDESARVFLKEAAFHNVVIQFDFKFKGASELRLVTGGGGGYNTVVQVKPKHFQINTAKRKDEFLPSHQGECAVNFKQGCWFTMTVEFSGDEVLAYVDDEHFVIGKHPIIDTERTYLALQVEGTSAHFDNFKIWESVRKADWETVREKLVAKQLARGPAMERDIVEQEKHLKIQVLDRLSRTDKSYRQLVATKESLQVALKTDYPKAFQTHKELSKSVAKRKSELKKDPRYKLAQKAVVQANKAVRDYIHSRYPDLDELPKHIYHARYEAHKLAIHNDARLRELEDAVGQREQEQKAAFPGAFTDVDSLVEERQAYAKSLKEDPEFRKRQKEVANAVHAVEEYVFSVEPRLKELKDAIQAAKKLSNE